MAVVLCKSLWARRDPRHRGMGYKLAATRPPLRLILAPQPTCSTRPIVWGPPNWTQVGVEDGAVTGPE